VSARDLSKGGGGGALLKAGGIRIGLSIARWGWGGGGGGRAVTSRNSFRRQCDIVPLDDRVGDGGTGHS